MRFEPWKEEHTDVPFILKTKMLGILMECGASEDEINTFQEDFVKAFENGISLINPCMKALEKYQN